jgi:hypothetical protein
MDDLLPSLGTKYTINRKLYKVTGYIVAHETLVILEPMEPTLLTQTLRIKPEYLPH